jgi:mannosyltransferase OCH1-like enzyme
MSAADPQLRIPRIFHQIWVGADPLPTEYARYRDTWLRHHPAWEHRLWTEENLPPNARRPEVYERLRNPGERSDVLRFELLSRSGGVYVDWDFECLRSIEPLLEGVEFFAAYKKPGRTNNAIIGSTPGHPIVERALAEIRPRTTYGVVDKEGTGPLFLDRLLAGFPDATILDREIFYPRTHKGRLRAYAVHHRGRAWQDAEGIRASLRKAERALHRAREDAEAWRSACARAEAELALLKRP